MNTVVIVLIAVAFIGAAVLYLAEAIRQQPERSTATVTIGIAGLMLLAYGIIAFFGAFLSATGGLPWSSENTAIPMWHVDGAVIDADGMIYCPSTPWGRVQLYDRDKRFVRGWTVNAFGGTFRLHIDRDNHLEVATVRRRMLYVFDRQGRLLSSASYEPRSDSDFDGWRGTTVTIPTPLYLLPFTHPFFAWATALVGMVMLRSTTRARRRHGRSVS
jgi:hypothetical protein